MSTFVCKNCHDKDAHIIECPLKFNNHLNKLRSDCDICGKHRLVSECHAYNMVMIKSFIRDQRRKIGVYMQNLPRKRSAGN